MNTLIIGGSSTFGKEIAGELALSGHNLLVSFFNKESKDKLEKLAELSKKNKKNIFFEQLDIKDESQIDKVTKLNQMKFSNLVYSVGTGINFKKIDEIDGEDLEEQFNVHVAGLWRVVNKLLQKGHPLKSILVIGSSCLFGTPPPRLSSYTVGKYGQLGLVKCLGGANARVGS